MEMLYLQDVIKSYFPIEAGNYKLVADNIYIDEQKLKKAEEILRDYNAQKELRLLGKSLTVPIYGDFTLYKDGKVVDKAKKMLIANLPVKLPRNTYLYKGSEYFISNQLRLKPGIYTRIKENGEVETHFNLAKWSFKLQFRDGIFYIKFTKGPSIPVYTLLRILGAKDEEIKAVLGDLFDKNKIYNEDAIVGWYNAYFPKGEKDNKEAALNEFKKALTTGHRFDPDIIKILLGVESNVLNKDMVLRALKKFIDVRQGKAEPDDRDSILFKEVLTEEDIVKDRLMSDSVRTNILHKIARNMATKSDIRSILPVSIFQSAIDGIFQLDLVNPLKQTNPVTIAENYSRITALGEGGIKSLYSVPEGARAVHPSQFGFIDPIRTPESGKLGVVVFRTLGSEVKNRRAAIDVINAKTLNSEKITVQEAYNKYLAFPDQYEFVGNKVKFKGTKIKALHQGKVELVSPNKIDYLVPDYLHMFTSSTVLLPFLQSLHPVRASKAANTVTQALPLVNREPPLVQPGVDENTSVNQIYGEQYSVRAPVDGVIKKIDSKRIVIKDNKGQEHKITLSNYLPLNQQAFFTFHPREDLKPGMKVKKGELLADSNFTRNGELALGVNSLVAFMPYKGLNFEDGIVISESFAKKLTSQRLFHFKYDITPDTKIDKKAYRALYPHEMTEQRFNKLDDEGVVKEGQIVEDGDILVAGLVKSMPGEIDNVIGKLSRKYVQKFKKHPLIWDLDFPGKVVDVRKTNKMISLTVLTEEPAVIGDKLTNNGGNKGVIVDIIPDNQMPRTKDGKVIDVIINPISILGRTNPSQIYEAIVSKAAKQAGKPIVVPNFSGNTDEFVKNIMNKYKVSDVEDLVDPSTGKTIKNVLVGYNYIYKLEHLVEKKLTARYREGYDEWDLTPAKGVEHPAQSVGMLEMYSILSHNAPNLLQEMVTYKTDKNPTFWEAIENNMPPPPPKPTFATSKFENMLRAIGVNVEKKGNLVRILPATKKDIDAMAGKEVKNAKLLIAGTLREDKGGLFDPDITGGINGMKWSHIKLPEPILSPLAIKAISVILDIPQDSLKQLIRDEKEVNGIHNVQELIKVLKSKTVDQYISELEERAKKAKTPADYKKINLGLRFLQNIKKYNFTWDDLLLDKIPVLPPRFRPITVSRDNTLFVSDFNLLYRDIKLAADTLEEAKKAGLPQAELKKLKKNLINTIESLYGLADPSSRYYGKRVPRGILDIIAGPKPKEGYFQSRILKKPQDLSGRSVITPDPSLHPDELGIPEEMAWKIFEPFILAKLKTVFMLSPAQARIELANRTEKARKAMEMVANERLVLLNRAPSLHKYNVLAFRPKIVEGNAIKVPNIVVAMEAGDFDGDFVHSTVVIKINNEIISSFSIDKNPPDWYIRLKTQSGGVNMAGYINLPVPISKDSEVYIVDLEDFPHGEKAFESDGRIFYHVPEGIEVLSYDEKANVIKWAPVKYWSVHPNNEVWIVNTYYGKQIYTDEDDRAVYGINPINLELTRAKPKLAEKLKLLIPIAKKFHINSGLKSIQLSYFDKSIKHELVEEKELTYDFGYFLGYFIGNGWAIYDEKKHRYKLNIAMDIKLKGSYIEHLLAKELGSLVKGNAKITRTADLNSYKITLTSKLAAKFMSDLIGKGAFNKHLPSFFLIANEEFRRGLLTGYLDADGSFGISHAKKKPQLMSNASTGSLRLAREIVLLAKSLGITANVCGYKSTFSKKQHWMITFSTHELLRAKLDFKNPKHLKKLKQISEIKDSGAKAKTDLVPFNHTLYAIVMNKLSESEQSTFRRSAKRGYISRQAAEKLLDKASKEIMEHELGRRWIAIVRNKDISWAPIKSVEKTEITETGYDLTVPPYENFMNVEGLILSNTTAVHVPVTKEALQDAFKMLPSQNWLHEAQPGRVWLTPKIEAILGLYKITAKTGKRTNKSYPDLKSAREAYNKGEIDVTDIINIAGKSTTLGRALVNDILPQEFRDPNIVLDKKKINSLMKELFEKLDQHTAADIAAKLNKLGAEFAYYTGSSVTLKDLEPIKLPQLEQASLKALQIKDPDKINRMAEKLRSQIKDKVRLSDNNFADFIRSGARAKFDSLMQMVASPIQLQDYTGKPFPYIVSKGYSKGMDLLDYLVASFGARRSAYEKVVQTGEPGELTKEMVASAIEYRITEKDCGTRKGIVMDVESADTLDRLLAEDVRKNGKIIARRNEPMEGEVVERIKKAKIDKVKVRSPLTCEAVDGICASCYGLDINKKLPEIGEYVGVKTAQYLSEPATQMSLSSIHTGGVVKDIGTDFKHIKNLLELHIPESERATIAKEAGKVDDVRRRPEGGWEIIVNGKSYITSPWVEPIVKKGQNVNKGDSLTTGIPHPKDLYDIAGPDAAMQFVVDYLDNAYQQNGTKLHRRNFELISKVMFDLGMITDPGDTDLTYGDTLSIQKIKKKNSELGTSVEIAVQKAKGRVLAKQVDNLSPGHKLTDEDIIKLSSKYVTVPVVPKPAKYTPVIRGVEQLPLMKDDWIARLGYRDIKNTILEGALRGWASDLAGWNPIPRIVYGKVSESTTPP